MNEKRKLELAESFVIEQSLVEIAYEKVHQELVNYGCEGKELEAAREIALFNVLGALDCKTDIWSTLLRSDIAHEIYRNFDSPDRSLDVFHRENTKRISDEVTIKWHESEMRSIEKIKSDI